MIKSVSFIEGKVRSFRVFIVEVSDWDGFDKLIKYTVKQFEAEVLEEVDGPDARRWFLKVRGIEFELIHSDGYGNYMQAASREGEEIIREIGRDIEQRLSQPD